MAEEKTIRVSMVMKEFNLGYGTLADYLSGKGIAVQGPNDKIAKDAYQLVAKDFGNDLLVKEQAKNLGFRRISDTYSVPKTADTVAATIPTVLATPAATDLAKKEGIIETPKHTIEGPKIIGKIHIPTEKELKSQADRERNLRFLREKAAKDKEIRAKAADIFASLKSSTRKKDKDILPKEFIPEPELKPEPAPEPIPVPVSTPVPTPVSTPVLTPVPILDEIETVLPSLELPKVLGSVDLDELDVEFKPKKKKKNKHRQQAERERNREKESIAEKEKLIQKAPALSQKELAAEKVAKRTAAAKEILNTIFDPFSKKKKEDAREEILPAPKPRQEDFVPTKVETLSGPKVLSKLDLSTIKDNKPDTPVRGKRKRIKSGIVDINKESRIFRYDHNDRDRNRKKGGDKAQAKFTKTRRVPAVINVEDVDKQMKETLAKMMEKGVKTKTSKYRREKRSAVSEKIQAGRAIQDEEMKTLELTEFVTVSDLSKMMDTPINDIIEACMNLGLMVSLSQRLDAEAIALIVENFGYKASFISLDTQNYLEEEADRPEDLLPRAPIATVMGHVDHGKTSLIDNIRKTNIIAGEAGGITQHIGAYQVDLPDNRQITFLDTPGHEAFTAMRARGAKATDVAIIIVAADDSVMPQTVEAINHAVAASVPMIFAINKIDKPGAEPDKIREQLSKMNYLVEDWGGKYQVQEIAAKSGVNVDKLLEKILVETDLLELKANPNRRAKGVVIESLLDKGRGYISRVLVQNGTLHTGDILLSGRHVGKVKAMFNERGKKIKEAGPSVPVEILGLNGATTAGDSFNVMEDEREARAIASKREQLQRMQGLRTQKHITLDEIGRRIAIGNFRELNIIVKADVDGSMEALSDSLLKLSTEQVQVNVIHKAVGAVTTADVQLAIAAEAIIVCFQVRPSSAIRKTAEQEGVDIRSYSIIYDTINEIKDAIEGMRAPEFKEKVVCTVEILQIYHVSKVGTVAGGIVREGKITRQTKVRVIRDGIVIHTGKLDSLKRFKDDIKEVKSGFECGLNISGFNDVEIGDVIEGYEMEEV